MDGEHFNARRPLAEMLQNTLAMYPSMHPCIRQSGVRNRTNVLALLAQSTCITSTNQGILGPAFFG